MKLMLVLGISDMRWTCTVIVFWVFFRMEHWNWKILRRLERMTKWQGWWKESLLGVLNTLYGTGGSLVSSTFGAKASGNAADISQILSANFTQAEGLAFIFTISFNMPCVSALVATARETHSVKWTAKISVFYTAAALIVSCIVYHIGLLVFWYT